MDLIYTNANRIDQGVLKSHALDLSYGASENDLEITLGADESVLEFGSMLYMEGTEYGGVIDGIKVSTNGKTIVYKGRTWHGILNSKIIEPDSGEDYLIVSGEANVVLSTLIDRLGLSGLFAVVNEPSGINISKYQFHRYCMGYDGLLDMLADSNAKLKFTWKDRLVYLSAEPIVDYTNAPIDGDIATLAVEQYSKKVNHLICLGKGELASREVIHLYVDQFGRIGDVQYYTGIEEITDKYENTNAESSDALRSEGVKRLKELRNNDTAEISINEDDAFVYDIGDVVSAYEVTSGIKVATKVTQKIIRINNGVVSTEYKTEG